MRSNRRTSSALQACCQAQEVVRSARAISAAFVGIRPLPECPARRQLGNVVSSSLCLRNISYLDSMQIVHTQKFMLYGQLLVVSTCVRLDLIADLRTSKFAAQLKLVCAPLPKSSTLESGLRGTLPTMRCSLASISSGKGFAKKSAFLSNISAWRSTWLDAARHGHARSIYTSALRNWWRWR